jgi:hypothetical protein
MTGTIGLSFEASPLTGRRMAFGLDFYSVEFKNEFH